MANSAADGYTTVDNCPPGGCASTTPPHATGSRSIDYPKPPASAAGVSVTAGGFEAAGCCPPAHTTVAVEAATAAGDSLAAGGLAAAGSLAAAGGSPPAYATVAGEAVTAAGK